jgi:hypothetical protein
MKTKILTMTIAIIIGMGIGIGIGGVVPVPVQASHGTDKASCENDGLYDGKNNPFSQELYDMCGDTYYQAFIEGCMSVDNSRDVCESATDAD